MKHYFAIIIFCFTFLYSCADTEVEIFQKEVIEADKIKIYFYDVTTGRVENQDRVFTIENKTDIEKYKDLFTNEDVPIYKCGYTGLIEFFKTEKSIKSMEFNLNPECRHIVFTIRERAFSKSLSEGGFHLLYNEFIKLNN